MKSLSTAALLAASLILAGSAVAQTAAKAPAAPAPMSAPVNKDLPTQKEKASYAIGMSVGHNLKAQEVDVDPDLILKGLKDTLSGNKALLTDQEAQAALTTLQQESRAKLEAKNKALGESNKKEGEEFLAANKSKPGVQSLPDGLQYKVIKQGDGPKPVATDTVECNYRGTLIDGKEFDSSYKRGQSASFPVNGVIKGWTEILQMMPVGSKYEVYIPSELAYGANGPRGSEIGPNATLIFEVELLSVS
jgi:FKBP-type peptidyl-prolyl cis-trans isomerase